MDEFDNESNQQAEKMGSKLKQTAKKAGNKVKSAVANSARVATKVMKNPLFWKALLIFGCIFLAVFFIIVIIEVIASAFSFNPFNPVNGTLGSVFGIQSDKFYGARMIYEDDETANAEIKDIYLKFTQNIIIDINNDNAKVSIDTTTHNNNQITILVTNFAKQLALNTNPTANVNTLDDSLNIITHYGFNDSEKSIVFNSIASDIKDNGLTTTEKTELTEKMQNAYSNEKYSIIKKILPKITIKDKLFTGNNTELEELTREKYLGYVFMPKDNVTFKTLSFRFVVTQNHTAEVELKHYTQSGIQTIKEKTTIDYSWYNVDTEEFTDYEVTNLSENVTPFTAINTANIQELADGVSIYYLLANNLYSTYFKVFEGECTGQNLLENINSDNYIYLQCSNDGAFNLAEYVTEY